jgi:hypothetical protein
MFITGLWDEDYIRKEEHLGSSGCAKKKKKDNLFIPFLKPTHFISVTQRRNHPFHTC